MNDTNIDKNLKRVKRIDHFMNRVIKLGGIGIIIIVMGIFVFILMQIWPIFERVDVSQIFVRDLKIEQRILAMGVDEWAEHPFFLTDQGQLIFYDIIDGTNPEVVDLSQFGITGITAVSYNAQEGKLLVGFGPGLFKIISVLYSPDYENGTRIIRQRVQVSDTYSINDVAGGPKSWEIDELSYGQGRSRGVVVALAHSGSNYRVDAFLFTQNRSLLGDQEARFMGHRPVPLSFGSAPLLVRVSSLGDTVVLADKSGLIHVYQPDGAGEFVEVQSFSPFAQQVRPEIDTMNFLVGGNSLYLTSPEGVNLIYSVVLPTGKRSRQFQLTKVFDPVQGRATAFDKSLVNKGFLVGSERDISLRYGTTAQVRWHREIETGVRHIAINKKYKHALLLDGRNYLHLYALNDDHPEGGWRAFFGRVWYEGGHGPEYRWQSTGGSDEYEPKLSLIPLIIGTLKGTVYAMLFAIPIALLAAIYTSEFMHPRFKLYIKPTMELMAALPSVILGFLAALWLAPLIEDKIPSVICVLMAIPLSAVIVAQLIRRSTPSQKKWIPNGYEFLYFIPILLGVTWLSWHLGPVIEPLFFSVTDPNTRDSVASFKLWWASAAGVSFQQRNSLIVGFMMGFAVIPIIFTIAEDTISAVPHHLRYASLACGASRWQTTMRVVLPTAAAGIFSAIMIGLGRAVGETMIVLMATGNTPIMEWNIFSGMRTLAANLAVELPEAPHHSMLYRTLYLGAFVLFLMTFFINTIAEVMRQYLRKKYRDI